MGNSITQSHLRAENKLNERMVVVLDFHKVYFVLKAKLSCNYFIIMKLQTASQLRREAISMGLDCSKFYCSFG